MRQFGRFRWLAALAWPESYAPDAYAPARTVAIRSNIIHAQLMKYAFGPSVGERGQITIERSIRERLGTRARDIAVQRVEDGRLIAEFIRPHEPHMRSRAGILGAAPGEPGAPIDQDLDAAVDRGIAEESSANLASELPGPRPLAEGRTPADASRPTLAARPTPGRARLGPSLSS